MSKTMTPEDYIAMAQYWSDVSQTEDRTPLGEILADDFVFWYNFEGIDRTKAEFMETLKNARKVFKEQRHTDLRIVATTEGFVMQATMHGLMDGQPMSSRFCLIATVRDGKIVRGEEYFDTGQMTRHVGQGGTELVRNETVQ